MGKKWDLSGFEPGMAVGARRAGLSKSETADQPTTISGFTENGPKKRKYPVKMPGWCERSEEEGPTGSR